MLRAAGVAVAVSGAVTLLLTVIAFGVLFVLAVIPALVGLFQARTGIWIAIRSEATSWAPLAAAGLGVLVGFLHLPDGMLNPAGDQREAARLALGLFLIVTNSVAAWVFITHGVGRRSVS